MKKFISVMALLLSSIASYAQDYAITIPEVSVRAGHSAVMSVEISNVNDLMAYQFKLDVPEGITITGGNIDGTRTTALGGAATNFDPSGNNPYIVQVYGNDKEKPITGTSGVVCNLTITADASATLGAKTITVRDIQMTALVSNTLTQIDDAVGGDFTINVTENVLDLYDDATTAPAASSATENVVLHRNMTANIWNSFVVPFDMDATQIEEAFGAGAQVAEFTNWTADDKDEATEITMAFTSVSEITANTPVIVKPTKSATYTDGISITAVNGITPDADATTPIELKFGKAKRTFTFTGAYVPVELCTADENQFYLKDNKFYYAVAGVTMKGYRAYMECGDTYLPAIFEVKMCIDEDVTAINGINADRTNGKAYSIDGKYVGKDVNFNRLQKGVYIVNGKKVIK